MSLKKFALLLSLLTMTSSAVFTATSCACSPEEPKSMAQRIVEYFNRNEYTIEVTEGSQYKTLLDQFTAENVKPSLPEDLREGFIDEAFEVIKIVKLDGEELTDEDLKVGGVIVEGYVVYNYESFLDQRTVLNITVTSDNTRNVIAAIRAATYETTVEINSTYDDLVGMINKDDFAFIKDKLDDEIKPIFDPQLFTLDDIAYDEGRTALQDRDFENYGVIREGETLIDFDYDNVEQIFTSISIRVIAKDEPGIINAITDADYQAEVEFESEVKPLLDIVNTPKFIRDQLSEELQQNFDNGAYEFLKLTDTNGNSITTEDLEEQKVIDAQIHYNYGSSEGQITSVRIDVTKKDLKGVLEGFQTKDWKDQVGLLDGNVPDIVQDQIIKFMGIESFGAEGLEFVEDSLTATSIILKARADSNIYRGEKLITWNLKLFEIWGTIMSNDVPDRDLRAGLKVYFYLEHETNLIKVYDVFTAVDGRRAVIHRDYQNYHRFVFRNANDESTKTFTMNGTTWRTDDVPPAFGELAFEDAYTVLFTSPDPTRVRTYNHRPTGGAWNNGANNRLYTIDRLGRITW